MAVNVIIEDKDSDNPDSINNDRLTFIPIFTFSYKLDSIPIRDGNLIVTIDDFKIYVDEKNERLDLTTKNGVRLFVTREEKEYWNSKADWNHTHHNVSETADGFMSKEDKIKLDAISASGEAVDRHVIFEQAVSSDVWEITHNMGKHPAVSIVDSAGSIVEGDITYIDNNSLKITFTAPFSGKVYLN